MPFPLRPALALFLVFVLVLVAAAPPCTHEGSRFVPGRFERGPPLRCEVAPSAAAWRLYTPPHRETEPRAGHTFVRARQVPRLLVVYGCTGRWLWPVVVREVRVQGYVFDVTTAACR